MAGTYISSVMLDLIAAGERELVTCVTCGVCRVDKVNVHINRKGGVDYNLSAPCECGEETGFCASLDAFVTFWGEYDYLILDD